MYENYDLSDDGGCIETKSHGYSNIKDFVTLPKIFMTKLFYILYDILRY